MSLRADPDKPNKTKAKSTPRQIMESLKDLELQKTMQGLINMTNSSTKVVRGTQLREEKRQRRVE